MTHEDITKVMDEDVRQPPMKPGDVITFDKSLGVKDGILDNHGRIVPFAD